MNCHSPATKCRVYRLFSWLFFQACIHFSLWLATFLIKCSNNFCTVEINTIIWSLYSIFYFFDHKNVFWPIWRGAFFKNIFVFLPWLPTLNSRIFVILLNSMVKMRTELISAVLILIFLWYVLLYLSTILFSLSM